ncbi:hypothetical protein [Paraburkholderia sp.]|uniref:hypothetical protein n=1 Tax=Paraburkholderia sp. TaxID=1926495 RepID=UPI002D4E8212|nr:hypothetical protein [Paraburkholderia sp.]HZZ02833.1 hypothetical protein [Paraburkholderia sp.]
MFKANPQPQIKQQELLTQEANAKLANPLQTDPLIQYLSPACYRPAGNGRLLAFHAAQNLGNDIKIWNGSDVQDMGQPETWQTTLEVVFGVVNPAT